MIEDFKQKLDDKTRQLCIDELERRKAGRFGL